MLRTDPARAANLAGWRLNLALVVGTVIFACLLVPLVSVLVSGRIGPYLLKISLISGLIVATVLVVSANEIAKLHRRRLEAGVAAARDRLGVALVTAQMVLWELDLRTQEIRFDHEKLAWLGISTDAAAGSLDEWLALIHPDDLNPFMQQFQAAMSPDSTEFALEYRMRQASGDWGWVHTLGRVTEKDAAGAPLLATGGTINVNQRKLAEAQLRSSEARLRATLASVDEGVLMIGHDGRVLSTNQRFLELWRVPQSLANTDRDELLIAHVLDQLNDPEAFVSLLNRLYGSDDEARDTLSFKDGRVFTRFTRAVRIDGERCRIWCFRDTTAQALAQAEISASEQKWRTILDSVDACIYLKDAQGRYLFANQATCDLWHTTLEQVIGRVDADFFDEATTAAILKNDRHVFESGEKVVIEETNLVSETGQSVIYLSTKLPLRHNDGSVYALCGISTDVTAIVTLNAQLEESNHFLSALMEAIPVPIFYKDAQGRYLGVNQAYEQFLMRPRSAIIGATVFDIAPHDLAATYDEQDKLLMQRSGTQSYETRVEDGAGVMHEVMFHKACFLDATGAVQGLIGALLDVTERNRSVLSLRESEQRARTLNTLLRMVTDNVPDMIWAKGIDKRYLFANKAICEQLLMARDTDEPLGKDDLYFAMRERTGHPENPQWHTFGELCQDSDAVTLQCGRASRFEEFGNVRGELLYLDVRKAPLVDETGAVIGVVGTGRDITQEREGNEKLRIAALVLANSSEALLLSDAENRIVDVNPAFTQLTGYQPEEVIGRDPRIFQSGRQGPDFYKAMWSEIETTGRWQGEVWNRRKNGDIFVEWLTVNTLFHEDGSVHRRVGLFSDITDKKRSEELIWNQANFDHLTGLPNRRMFLDRLAQDIKKAHRGGFKLALMFLDLDRFKEINDTLGHDLGDQLLIEAARRISACARESDTVARIGGDEFTVILAELADASGVDRIANSILASLSQPFMLDSQEAYVSVSIGITLYPDDALVQEELLKNADQAMYVSKDGGRNRFSYFTRAMQEAAQHRMSLLHDLRGALALNQFEVHYQPVVALHNGRVCKAEALLRWTHPARGMVGPVDFIALAEDSGLIHDIGNWVFAQSAVQARLWRKELDPSFQISVNLSPVQIQAIADQLNWRSHLQAAGLEGDAIVLEITEGLLLDKSARVAGELLAYRDAGIQVAIDDFGTGYSAMSYLKQLDIDYLKIDRSFVRNLGLGTSDIALCQAMVVMAHTLGLKVIAEGVETMQQHDLLKAMGCDFGQGFLYSRALEAGEFEKWWRGSTPWHA